MEAVAEIEQAPVREEDRRPLFTPEQQKAFDRAFARREAKLRREHEAKLALMRNDLSETVAIAKQLLERCADRVSREDAKTIRQGLMEIKEAHGTN
jgi:hypothetical protein